MHNFNILVFVAEQAGLSMTWSETHETGPEVIKLMKFQLLLKTKMLKKIGISCF